MSSKSQIKKFKVSASAVENWTRLNNLDLVFDEARKELIKQLKKKKPSNKPPNWMNSVNPEIKLWINFNNQVSLTVKDNLDPNFKYLISNAVAPKNLRKQATKLGIPLNRSSFNQTQIENGLLMTSSQLAEDVLLSEHSIEQFNSRLNKALNKKQILKIINASGKMVYPPPFWADAARRKQPVIMVTYLKQTIAFTLAASGEEWTITTAIPQNWSLKGFYDLTGKRLLDKIYLPGKYDNQEVRQAILEAKQVLLDPQKTFIKTDRLLIIFRPADSLQRQQRTSGKAWFIERVNQIG